MLLAIDVGNSQVAIGLGDRDRWVAKWHLATDPRRTVDEYSVLLADLLCPHEVTLASVSGVVISSVVPAVTPAIVCLGRDHCGCQPLLVGPGVHTGMDVRYRPAAELGTDRLAGALAARERFGAPVVVVDFGTATTLNVVDRAGAFAGGAIAPGVGTSAEALGRATARLRPVDAHAQAGMPVVGRNTETSVRSGLIYGHAGLVAGLLGRMLRELGDDAGRQAPVVATGGYAQTIAPLVDRIGSVVPGLVLDGLRRIAELNGVVPWATH